MYGVYKVYQKVSGLIYFRNSYWKWKAIAHKQKASNFEFFSFFYFVSFNMRVWMEISDLILEEV